MSIDTLMTQDKPIRVMIVDDSAVVRNVLSKLVGEDDELELVYSAYNAQVAIDFIKVNEVEVVLLDIEMPGISGLDAIQQLLKLKPKLKILMVSALTSQNAPSTLKSLSLGAADYIEKPSAININDRHDFKETLLEKIKVLGYASRNINTNTIPRNTINHKKSGSESSGYQKLNLPKFLKSSDIKLRADRRLNFKPDVIAIASSTGGPKSIGDLLLKFDKDYLKDIPVIITQHMPAFFTKLFAENIDKLDVARCNEAIEGEEIRGGRIYIAPGGHHLLVSKQNGKNLIKLSNSDPVNFCKPSADPMLFSMAEIYKKKLLLIVLTGMGSDALEGAKRVVEYGGVVIAQDEKSSVVWGMPGNVAVSNLCTEVLPLNEIANYIMLRGK